MVQDEGRVGIVIGADGSIQTIRLAKTGEVVASDAHGRYYEAASRGKLYYSASQAAQAISVALATTYTGNMLSNPLGSGYNLSLLQVGLALSVAPAAIATLGLIGGYSATTQVTHTTALTVGNTNLQLGMGVARADSAATIPTPLWLQHLWSGFTAAALPSTTSMVIDIAGSWVIPPGGFIGIGALTAVTGLWSLLWEEIALQ